MSKPTLTVLSYGELEALERGARAQGAFEPDAERVSLPRKLANLFKAGIILATAGFVLMLVVLIRAN